MHICAISQHFAYLRKSNLTTFNSYFTTMSNILCEAQLWQLDELLPARIRLDRLELLYSTSKDGFSLQSMYRCMIAQASEIRGTLLVIRDSDNQVFGAILSHPIIPYHDFFGNGETILFKFVDRDLHVFPWSGNNSLFVKADLDSLAIGAGCGHFGLWIDGELLHGRTQRCATFENEPLTSHEDFMIADVEVFAAFA